MRPQTATPKELLLKFSQTSATAVFPRSIPPYGGNTTVYFGSLRLALEAVGEAGLLGCSVIIHSDSDVVLRGADLAELVRRIRQK